MSVNSFKNKPWALGPYELLRHAEEHYKKEQDFDKRMSLIGFDNATEVSITAFLNLKPEQRENRQYEKKEVEKWLKNFNTKLDFFYEEYLLRESKKTSTLKSVALWLHTLRNEIYHSGNGVAPESNVVERIRRSAIEIFSILYDIDAEALLEAGVVQDPDPLYVDHNFEILDFFRLSEMSYGHKGIALKEGEELEVRSYPENQENQERANEFKMRMDYVLADYAKNETTAKEIQTRLIYDGGLDDEDILQIINEKLFALLGKYQSIVEEFLGEYEHHKVQKDK